MVQPAQTAQLFMRNLTAYIVPASIENVRIQIFRTQICKFGGMIMDSLSSTTSHVIVADTMETDRLCRIMMRNSLPTNIPVVKSMWLSSCIHNKHLLATTEYELRQSLTPEAASDSVQSSTDIIPPSHIEKVRMLFKQNKFTIRIAWAIKPRDTTIFVLDPIVILK
jgi:hypothetical protein